MLHSWGRRSVARMLSRYKPDRSESLEHLGEALDQGSVLIAHVLDHKHSNTVLNLI